MEMTARRGRGYVPAERNKVVGAPIGVMPIDSLFSPVKKVNYQVTTPASAGHRLRPPLARGLEQRVGAPADAVAFAAKIVRSSSPSHQLRRDGRAAPIELPKNEEKLNETSSGRWTSWSCRSARRESAS